MASETPFLRALLPSLPSDLAKKVRALCGTSDSAEYVLDSIIRFISGAESGTADEPPQWAQKQQAATQILNGMIPRTEKRPREDDVESDPKASKRQRPSAEDAAAPSSSHPPPTDPVFTIHAVSTTAPVRKKVDITIHKTTLVISHPTSHAVEATIPLETLTRAFLLPTRGKQKAHWTVVLLASDTPDRTKPITNGVNSAAHSQVIFGVDAAAATPLSYSAYTGTTPVPGTVAKGGPTRPVLLDFLAKLSTPTIEPTPDVFKSACVGIASGVSANEAGVPGIEAYRGAKPGSLWFTASGVLWGESKPCEFWAVEDLIGKSEGVRVVGGTGRTCSVVLTRKSGEVGVEDDGEDVGVETEFGMVDSREKAGIEAWVRAWRHLFGKKVVASEVKTNGQAEDDSEEEDEDFEMDSDVDLDGSESSSESSDEEGGGDEDAEGDAEESDEDGEEEDLKEENHPLLRPGAMPRRMDRAVIDMVVEMVEDDMLGTPNVPDSLSDGDELEEDQLDD